MAEAVGDPAPLFEPHPYGVGDGLRASLVPYGYIVILPK